MALKPAVHSRRFEWNAQLAQLVFYIHVIFNIVNIVNIVNFNFVIIIVFISSSSTAIRNSVPRHGWEFLSLALPG